MAWSHALQSLGIELKISEPALNIFINPYTVSHNVAPALEALGGQAKGTCSVCHSQESYVFGNAPLEQDDTKPCFNQPEGCKGLVFFQPNDTGTDGLPGLEMTCDGNDCSGNAWGICSPSNMCVGGINNGLACISDANCGGARITSKVTFKCYDERTVSVDITEGVKDGAVINNVINQKDVLCFNPQYLANLMAPQSSAYFANLKADFNWLVDETVSNKINFNGSFSLCPPGQVCTYSWDYGEKAAPADETNIVKPVVTYTAAGSYNVTLNVEDEHGYTATKNRMVLATDIAAVTVPAAAAVDNADGSATLTVTAGVVNLKIIYVLWNDGSAVQDVNAYNMTSRTVTHQFVGAPNTFTMAVYVIDMQGKGELLWLAPLPVNGP
jgi:hypothetical protein